MNLDNDDAEAATLPRLTEKERLLYAQKIGPMRRAVGLTQEQVAGRADVSRGTMGNMESGSSAPQTAGLLRVMRVLGMEHNPLAPSFRRSGQVQGWLDIIGPLIHDIPLADRERTMLGVVDTLTQAGRRNRIEK